MRINTDNNSMDMERRDFDHVMQAYLAAYMFGNKNVPPDYIIFPMFEEVKNPRNGKMVKVEYAPEISPVVQEIVQDGSNVLVRETTTTGSPPPTLATTTAVDAPRQPKLPPRPAEGYATPDDLRYGRMVDEERKTARESVGEVEVDETKEKEADIQKPKE